jgi:hypothetical protein
MVGTASDPSMIEMSRIGLQKLYPLPYGIFIEFISIILTKNYSNVTLKHIRFIIQHIIVGEE